MAVDRVYRSKIDAWLLVAVSGDQLVGHILYSPASIEGKIQGAALGPVAVHPGFRRKGIGSRLAGSDNRTMDEAGFPFTIVPGHADYYSRFGFQSAARHRVTCDWDVPDDAFMLLILDEERMRGVTGRAKYSEEFSVA